MTFVSNFEKAVIQTIQQYAVPELGWKCERDMFLD